MELHRLGPDDWQTWRDTRLAALAESPHVFGSSLAAEERRSEQDWRAWLQDGLKVVADGQAGLVAAWEPPDRGGAIELSSMWVAPAWRGHGVGGLLVEEVLIWAETRRVDLWVVEGNERAEALYRRFGFRLTEERQPHPGHEGVFERIMTRDSAA